jgi:hypothetical protein
MRRFGGARVWYLTPGVACDSSDSHTDSPPIGSNLSAVQKGLSAADHAQILIKIFFDDTGA